MPLMKGAPVGSQGYASPSGWIGSKIFLEWLRYFKSFVQPSANRKILLLLDNHCSDISLSSIEYAKENHIIMLSMPPHTSHRLQPLDNTFFGPLKVYYNQAIDRWMVNNPGKRVSNYEVCELFGSAYKKAATVQKAVNGFRSAGISPFNRSDGLNRSDGRVVWSVCFWIGRLGVRFRVGSNQ